MAESSAEPAAADESSTSWLGGYVSLPTIIRGNVAKKTYTAYHIVTILDKSAP